MRLYTNYSIINIKTKYLINMSLYSFVENYVNDCPELLLSTATDPKVDLSYKSLFNFFKYQEQSYPISSFYNSLFHPHLARVATNPIEYEILKQKTRKLSALTLQNFEKLANRPA